MGEDVGMESRRQNNSYSSFVMGSRIDLLLNWWALFLFLKETTCSKAVSEVEERWDKDTSKN